MTRAEARDKRHTRVRDAALRLFQERGFEATSVRDIAVAAGVSVGTVINAGGKTGLFLASMEENAFALVGGGVERLRAAPPGKRALAAEFTELFDTALTWVAANRELTRDYLIAYLRTGDADPKELNVIIDGLAERCLQHSADSDRQAAALAASVLYSVFVSLVFALAAGTTDLDTARQGLHAVVEAHVRPFGRAR